MTHMASRICFLAPPPQNTFHRSVTFTKDGSEPFSLTSLAAPNMKRAKELSSAVLAINEKT